MDKAHKSECAEEIEECMKALLNEYIYKSNKEFYVCGLAKILQEVRKCFKQEKLCKNNIFCETSINYGLFILIIILPTYNSYYHNTQLNMFHNLQK